MTPAELKSLIESDVTAKGLATANEWRALADHCGPIAAIQHRTMPAKEMQRAASLSGFWGRCRLAADPTSGSPSEVRALAITFVDWVLAGFDIDLTLAELQPMVQGLVASGILTTDEFNAMMALTAQSQVFTPIECRFAMLGY